MRPGRYGADAALGEEAVHVDVADGVADRGGQAFHAPG